jgi:predicted acylesterase/phospholipase RssA
LLLAGGGLKIAYQAGVLQVWLDELGVEFDHADAVSAATFNLAMWCQGMSGHQIADNWRGFRPLRAIDVNVRHPRTSLLSFDRFRRNVLPQWGLDWNAIRNSPRAASYNAYDVTDQRLRVFAAAEMSEDHLAACAALPMWFPPVTIDGHVLVDAVHVMGANLDHALDAGADELWIIWTTSTQGRWRPGPLNEYFQIFEECTNSHLRESLARIDRNNRCLAAGEHAQYGRHVTVRLLQHEVPLQYLLNFRHSKFRETVDLGVRDARRWCRANDVRVGDR